MRLKEHLIEARNPFIIFLLALIAEEILLNSMHFGGITI